MLSPITKDLIRSPLHSDETVTWALTNAIAVMQTKHKTAEWISAQANTTLTITLAALGGAATWAVRLFEPGGAMTVPWAAASALLWLAAVAAYLVLGTLMLTPIHAVNNEPRSLLIYPDATFREMQQLELEALQERIDDANVINETRAKRLNRARIALVCTPVVFVVAAAAAARLLTS